MNKHTILNTLTLLSAIIIAIALGTALYLSLFLFLKHPDLFHPGPEPHPTHQKEPHQ
jgi:hypothetical protein